MRVRYTLLALCNILLGIGAICLYLPYMLEAFDMAGFEWFEFVLDILKDNYYNVMIYFGIGLLLWFIVLNLITIPSKVNLPKFLCKITVVISLMLPLLYVVALKNDKVLEFWIKTIVPDIKMIAYVLLCVSWGNFAVALIYNFTHNNRANLHHLVEALFMCLLLTLMIASKSWCGWDINSSVKIYGILIGLFAIYLPISAIILFVCRKKKE